MNKVILMGRLTKNPEIRYTNAKNIAITNFTIAVDRNFSKEGEEKQADFINIIAWNKTAEFCEKYFDKGKKVAVYGRIETSSWKSDDGTIKYATKVVAEEVYFADSKKSETKNELDFENVDIDDNELPF